MSEDLKKFMRRRRLILLVMFGLIMLATTAGAQVISDASSDETGAGYCYALGFVAGAVFVLFWLAWDRKL